MGKANNNTKPKNISAHSWAKHKRLNAKAGRGNRTWKTKASGGS